MKIVVTSDWHLDAHTAGVPRFDDVARAVDESVQAMSAERASVYLFLGDLADPDSVSAWRAVAYVGQTMASICGDGFGNRSFWLAGNHDVLEDGYGSTVLSPLRSLANRARARIVERPEVCDLGSGVLAAFLPYTARSHAYDPEAFLRDASARYGQKIRLIASHLMLEGIGPGSETEDMPRGRDVFFPVDFAHRLFPWAVKVNGHYHRRHEFFRGVHVPGSLARLTRSEVQNQPSFSVMGLK